jgi:phage-related baseplate assembly protein
MESDEDLRRRAQLSFEGFSTAGPEGAYIFHGLGADPDVLDISVDSPRFSMATIDPSIMALLPADSIVLQVDYDAGLSDPMPGTVAVNVLSRTGNGTADAELIEAVSETLSTEDVRPLTDNVITRTAQIINYSIQAVLTVYPGPDSAVVLQAAIDAVEAYAEANHRLGRDVTLSGLYSALHQEGVQDVNLISPVAKVVANKNQATWCTGIVVTIGGTDE